MFLLVAAGFLVLQNCLHVNQYALKFVGVAYKLLAGLCYKEELTGF